MSSKLRLLLPLLVSVCTLYLASCGSNSSAGSASETMQAPTLLSATAGNASVELTWSEVAGADFYDVYYDSTAELDIGTATRVSTTSTAYTVEGLTNSTAYTFAVFARTALLSSDSSNAISATPLLPAPESLTTFVDVEEVRLTWESVAGANDYVVYYDYHHPLQIGLANTIVTTANQITLSTLDPALTWYFAVSARDDNMLSEMSQVLSADPLFTAPIGVSASPLNEAARVSWEAVEGAQSYTIFYNVGTTLDAQAASSLHVIGTDTVVGDLVNGLTYAFAVAANDDDSEGAISEIVTGMPQELSELFFISVYEGTDPVDGNGDPIPDATPVVDVEVTRSKGPVVLALSAYDPVEWRLNVAEGVELDEVILGGYEFQSITGLPEGTTLTQAQRELNEGVEIGHAYSKDHSAYNQVSQAVEDLSGLTIAGYRGGYTGGTFVVANDSSDYERDVSDAATEVFHIGVYEGTYPEGVQHSFGFHPLGSIDLSVTRTGAPIVLVLTSYEPVDWRLDLADGVVVSQVILSSTYPSQVSGAPAGTIIRFESHDRHSGRSISSSYSQSEMVEDDVEALIGFTFSGHIGTYTGEEFVIDQWSGHDDWTIDENAQLFALGVYEGTLPEGVEDGFRQHPTGIIEVHVTRTSTPVVLALTSYEPVEWQLIVDEGVELNAVVLGGNYQQSVTGVPGGTIVRNESLNPSAAKPLRYAYSRPSEEYNGVLQSLVEITGLYVSGFKGGYRGEHFEINNSSADSELAIPDTNSELHVIGVYEGSYPPGEGHSFGNHPTGDVTVNVTKTGVPLVLYLCSYEPVNWTLNVAPGVELVQVITGGYYAQEVSNLPDGVVVRHEHRLNNTGKSLLWAFDTGDEDYDTMVSELLSLTGLDALDSFQGSYTGATFVLD